MKIKYIIIFLSLVLNLSLGKTYAQQQGEKKTTITSTVTDDKGAPIAGAIIYGDEGAVCVMTDVSGKFTIKVAEGSDIIRVDAVGFETHLINPSTVGGVIILQQSVPMFGKNDWVNVAYRKMPKGELTGAVSVLNPDEIVKYDNIEGVTEALYSRIPGMYGGSNIRGIGGPVFIIDGLPRDPNYVHTSEIESITVLKDANAAILYGAQALNGVVLINTKRGEAYKKKINVWSHYGIDVPIVYPKYLSSADYMEQYNVARANDGMAPQYSDETINNYRNGNPYRYPSIDYYSDDYLKSFRPFSKVMVDLSGGNKRATYYSNLAWENVGDLLNFGNGKNLATNRFNARGNVDLIITDMIKTSVDAVGTIINEQYPIAGYWNRADTLRPDLFAPLLPIDLIDPELDLFKGRKNEIEGKYLAGGNASYLTNPITSMYLGGNLTWLTRNFSFTNRVDVDLSKFVQGLGFHTNISFDYWNFYYQYISNGYSVYQATWDPASDRIVGLSKFGEDVRTGNQNVGNAYGQRRFGVYAMFDYDRTFNDVHHVSGNLLGYGSNIKRSDVLQSTKYTNIGLRLSYAYDRKYMVDFSSAVVSSQKLDPDNRIGFSPTIGLGWVMSSEDFMSSSDFVDYLKIKMSAGIMNVDNNLGYYWYDEPYGGSGTLYWYEGSRSRGGVISAYGGNRNLAYEKRKDINIGLEGMLFDKKLSFDAFYFNNIHDGIVARPTNEYPSYMVNYVPYENYNKNAYRGFELGLTWKQQLNDFTWSLGGNIMYTTSERLKVNEVYQNDYQYRKGHPVDARFGLVADGFFMSRDEVNSHEYQSFGAVQPGDIKYIDQNKDGIIDSNDERMIGRWQAPFSYGLHLMLSYKRMTLIARGFGSTGADGYMDNSNNNHYFWAQGNVKYSEFMLNNWTEATKNTATYPRLSTTANNNNFRSSTFWLYNNDYFTLNRIQLTYDVPIRPGNILTMKNLSVFINGSNLFMISKSKDILRLNVHSEPQYRSFSIGLKTTL